MRDKQRKRIPRFEFESLEPTALGKSYEGLDGEGIVYLIQSSKLNSYKIGITSPLSSSSRISQHRRNGWSLIEIYRTKSMQAAFDIEQSVINWWRRELRLWQSVDSENMPQGGSTETVGSHDLSIEKLKSYVEQLIQHETQELNSYSKISNLTIGSLVKLKANVVYSRLDAEELSGQPKRTRKSKPTKIKKPVIRATVSIDGKQVLIEKHLYRTNYKEQTESTYDTFLILTGQTLEIVGRVFPIDENQENLGLLNPRTYELDFQGQPLSDNRELKEKLENRRCCCGGLIDSKTVTKQLLKFGPRVVDFFWHCAECGKEYRETSSVRLACGSCVKGYFGVDRNKDVYRCGFCKIVLDDSYLRFFGDRIDSKPVIWRFVAPQTRTEWGQHVGTRPEADEGVQVEYKNLINREPRNRVEWEEKHGPIPEDIEDIQSEFVDPDTLPDYS